MADSDRDRGVMTRLRQHILEAALRELDDPLKLIQLAESFEKVDLPDAASKLREKAIRITEQS